VTTEKISEKEHGKGDVTATTVPCKLQQWDRWDTAFHRTYSCF